MKAVKVARLLAFVAVAAVALATVVVVYDMMLVGEEQHFLPMKDSVVAFIASNHPDAVAFLSDLDLIYQGSGVFSGDGWYIEFECAGQNCTAYADFSMARVQNSSGIPHRILWSGGIANGTVTEISYTHAV